MPRERFIRGWRSASGWRHVPRDFAIGMVVFAVLLCVLNVDRQPAIPLPVVGLFAAIEPAPTRVDLLRLPELGFDATSARAFPPMARAPSPALITVLSVVFASVLAFNVGIVRHLCRVQRRRSYNCGRTARG